MVKRARPDRHWPARFRPLTRRPLIDLGYEGQPAPPCCAATPRSAAQATPPARRQTDTPACSGSRPTLPRPSACQLPMRSEPHSVLPQPQQNEYVNRHRRSTWAGVSWPNDDEHDGRDGDGKRSAFARRRTTRSTRARTITCAFLCASSRVKPPVKCSRRK